jgi:hypothetical protein
MMNDEKNLGSAGKMLFATALGVTLDDVIDICRMIDEMEGDFKKGDNHG